MGPRAVGRRNRIRGFVTSMPSRLKLAAAICSSRVRERTQNQPISSQGSAARDKALSISGKEFSIVLVKNVASVVRIAYQVNPYFGIRVTLIVELPGQVRYLP